MFEQPEALPVNRIWKDKSNKFLEVYKKACVDINKANSELKSYKKVDDL